MGDKETILFALVHSGCKQNTGDTESSLTLLQDSVYRQWCLILFKFPFLSVYACSFQHELLASCRLNTLFLYLLCSFSALCFLPCCNHDAFPPYQPHRSSGSCTGTTSSLCLSPALLLLLTDDCTASWRRVCLLHCAKPFYITTDSCDTLTSSKVNKKFH